MCYKLPHPQFIVLTFDLTCCLFSQLKPMIVSSSLLWFLGSVSRMERPSPCYVYFKKFSHGFF